MHNNIPNMIFNTGNVSSIILVGFSCSTLTMFPLSHMGYADITQVLGACVGHLKAHSENLRFYSNWKVYNQDSLSQQSPLCTCIQKFMHSCKKNGLQHLFFFVKVGKQLQQMYTMGAAPMQFCRRAKEKERNPSLMSVIWFADSDM